MTSRRKNPDEPLRQPTEEEFEELVAAALKVNPKGVSTGGRPSSRGNLRKIDHVV